MRDSVRTGVKGRLLGDRLKLVLLLIAAATVVSGMAQVIAPGFVLGLLSAEKTTTAKQFFGTIGMFMALFGGLLAHALLDRKDHPVVVLWASLQKFGAVAAVVIGVWNNAFSTLALSVASFDLLSGLLGMAYWRRIRS